MASMAQAQLLPAPHQQNPDWSLQKVEAQSSAGIVTTPATDRMPNGIQQSISSAGNHRRVWDAKRQLAYEWTSRPDEMAPDKLVRVREQQTGTVYVYTRKTK